MSRAFCHRQPAAQFGGDVAVSTSSWHREKKKSIICSSYTPPPPFLFPSRVFLEPRTLLYFQCVVCSIRFRILPFPRKDCCKRNLPKICYPSVPTRKKVSFLSSLVLFHDKAEINNTASLRNLLRWAENFSEISACNFIFSIGHAKDFHELV